MIPGTWKKEFRLELLGLVYNRPEQFVRCQWQKKTDVNITYLVYRWLLAAYFCATMISSLCDAGRDDRSFSRFVKWPIYLTNWGYTVCTVQAFLAAYLITRALSTGKDRELKQRKESVVSRTVQLYWILHTIAVVVAFTVSVSYWVAVYNPVTDKIDTLNYMFHAVNSIMMAVDFFVVSHPFRLLHCYWPVALTTIYAAFSIIYFEAGGLDRLGRTYIYPHLNWNTPLRACLASMCGIVFVIAVHCATWILYLFRQWVYEVVTEAEKQDDAESGFANDGNNIQVDILEHDFKIEDRY